MDNQNNPNWPNNLNPITPTPLPNGSIPTPSLTPDPINNPFPSAQPAPATTFSPLLPSQNGMEPSPTPLPNNMGVNPFPDGGVTQPIPTQPISTPPEPVQPVPTFTQTTSPLDNPWGAPAQPSPLDGSQPPPSQPTWVPPNPIGSTNNTIDQQPSSNPSIPPTQIDPAPTDLSHLISNNPQETNGQNLSSAETLVPPSPSSNSVPQVPTLPTQEHKGIPKWLIGVGVGLLIIVIGASAYFILGIGQPKNSNSIPAEVSKPTVKVPPPITTPVPQTAPAATGSANFGQLQGSSSATPQATSAADLVRQRQQGR